MTRVKRASYRAALFWLAANDDTEWIDIVRDGKPDPVSVSAALVIDLFGVDEVKFRADLRRELERQGLRDKILRRQS